MRDTYEQSSPAAPVFEHPCSPLTKIMSSGTFYYAMEPHRDLSSRLFERLPAPGGVENDQPKDIGEFDERFVWNEYIVRSLLDFRDRLDAQEKSDLDRCQFIVSLYI
jgi:synaptojanin